MIRGRHRFALPQQNPPPCERRWPLALPIRPSYFDRGPGTAVIPHKAIVYFRQEHGDESKAALTALLNSYPAGTGASLDGGDGSLILQTDMRWGPATA